MGDIFMFWSGQKCSVQYVYTDMKQCFLMKRGPY